MSDQKTKEHSRHGGPARESAANWSEGRKIGFVEGATFVIEAGAEWAQSMADDGAKTVLKELVPKVERIFPDAEKLYAPFKALKQRIR